MAVRGHGSKTRKGVLKLPDETVFGNAVDEFYKKLFTMTGSLVAGATSPVLCCSPLR